MTNTYRVIGTHKMGQIDIEIVEPVPSPTMIYPEMAYNKSQHLILNGYNELLWQCIPQGKNELDEDLWEEHVSEAIKQDYYDQNQSDFSNGRDIIE